MIKFCLTIINEDGARFMPYPHNASATHDTERAARDHLIAIIANNSAAALADWFGDVEQVQVRPVECYAGGDPKKIYFDKEINTPAELVALAGEFENCLIFAGDTAESSAASITEGKYKRLMYSIASTIEHSTPEYSLIIPECSEVVEVDGGQWLPALVFIPD